jgi:NADH-quinone oxidoreductase subunit F
MPADKREIIDALDEGIKLHELVAPVRFLGNGSIKKIECVKMELGKFGSDGRRTPKKIEGSNFFLDIDMAIPAVSQYSDLPFVKKEEVEITEWGTFIIDSDTQMTSQKGVFAGGDVARGSDVVITAIADGKNAARSIDKFLGGNGELNTGKTIEIPVPNADESDAIEHERFSMKYLDPEKRRCNFEEVSQGFHKLNAIAESMRCLQCSRR